MALGPATEVSGVLESNFAAVSPSRAVAPDNFLANGVSLAGAGFSSIFEKQDSSAPSTLSNPAQVDPASVDLSSPTAALAVARVPFSQLANLHGTPLLTQLGILSKSQLLSFVSTHPKSVDTLIASPPQAREVLGWWSSLDKTTQKTLVKGAPKLVGNLNGVPTEVRNQANLYFVKDSIASLHKTMTSTPVRSVAEDARHQIHMLDQIKAALVASKGESKSAKSAPGRSLLSVDSTGQGRAAIVIGDIATADYVTYMVPGMFFTVDGQVDDWTDDAAELYKQQVGWLKLVSQKDPTLAHKSVAVVAWMGYQTPDLTNIGSLDLAYQGRDALAHAVEGMQAERAGNEPYTTIIAHSYGSTAALMALTEYNFSVDALAVVGSPGSAAQSVDQLHVRNGNVWVGEAAWDPVPNSAWFGSDPGAKSYGSHRMNVGGGVDAVTGKKLDPSYGHNEYFSFGSESMRNMALIGIGQDELVTTGSAKDKHRTLSLVR